ncbi:MAG: rhomboid family intramembrane serine protease, partial [Planctomycetaceae bacterium]|nr:rhomboid family intramembrane serine protease [Planctomycetaceae bacterium]
CGAAGGIVYTVLVRLHVLPALIMVGASGAIYGVMAAVACMFPRLRVLLWGIIPMTMVWLVILAVIVSLLSIVTGRNVGGELAHMTGLAVGFVYVLCKPWATGFRMRHQKGAWTRKIDQEKEFLQEVDEILEKVHREGIQSLNWRERHTLQEATRREQQNAQR